MEDVDSFTFDAFHAWRIRRLKDGSSYFWSCRCFFLFRLDRNPILTSSVYTRSSSKQTDENTINHSNCFVSCSISANLLTPSGNPGLASTDIPSAIPDFLEAIYSSQTKHQPLPIPLLQNASSQAPSSIRGLCDLSASASPQKTQEHVSDGHCKASNFPQWAVYVSNCLHTLSLHWPSSSGPTSRSYVVILIPSNQRLSVKLLRWANLPACISKHWVCVASPGALNMLYILLCIRQASCSSFSGCDRRAIW